MATAEEREKHGVLLSGKAQTPDHFPFMKQKEKFAHWNLGIWPVFGYLPTGDRFVLGSW
jgi:hypothetical protein